MTTFVCKSAVGAGAPGTEGSIFPSTMAGSSQAPCDLMQENQTSSSYIMQICEGPASSIEPHRRTVEQTKHRATVFTRISFCLMEDTQGSSGSYSQAGYIIIPSWGHA